MDFTGGTGVYWGYIVTSSYINLELVLYIGLVSLVPTTRALYLLWQQVRTTVQWSSSGLISSCFCWIFWRNPHLETDPYGKMMV